MAAKDKTSTTAADNKWANRIVGHDNLSPEVIMLNPKNARVHPKQQRDALEGVMSEVGWVQAVIVNKQNGLLVDGHLRVEEARKRGESTVPVTYVDLSPEEEAYILATFDPISGMAQTDLKKLDALAQTFNSGNEAIQAMLGAMLTNDRIAAAKGYEDNSLDAEGLVPHLSNPIGDYGDDGEIATGQVFGGAGWSGQTSSPYAGDSDEDGEDEEDGTLNAMFGRDGEDDEDSGGDGEEGEEKPRDAFIDIPDHLGGAFALKDGMDFPRTELYDIPPLMRDMLGDLPDDLELWPGDDLRHTVNEDSWKFLIYSSSCQQIDFHRTVLGFYTEDKRFEVAWNAPARFGAKLINSGVPIAISPNYTVSPEMPLAVNLYQIFRSRWVARYFQESQIRIIPDIVGIVSYDVELSIKVLTAGLPRGLPAVSIQYQNLEKQRSDESYLEKQRYILEQTLEKLQPGKLLVYTGLPGRQLLESWNLPVQLVFLPTLRNVRQEYLKKKKGKLA